MRLAVPADSMTKSLKEHGSRSSACARKWCSSAGKQSASSLWWGFKVSSDAVARFPTQQQLQQTIWWHGTQAVQAHWGTRTKNEKVKAQNDSLVSIIRVNCNRIRQLLPPFQLHHHLRRKLVVRYSIIHVSNREEIRRVLKAFGTLHSLWQATGQPAWRADCSLVSWSSIRRLWHRASTHLAISPVNQNDSEHDAEQRPDVWLHAVVRWGLQGSRSQFQAGNIIPAWTCPSCCDSPRQ